MLIRRQVLRDCIFGAKSVATQAQITSEDKDY